MNEEKLKQILDVEQRAQAAYELAVFETKEIPAQAEDVVKAIIQKAQTQAELDAAKLVDQICDPQSINEVLEQNKQKMESREALAAQNMNKAVDFVIQSLLGETSK